MDVPGGVERQQEDEARTARGLRTLLEVSLSLVASLDLEEILQATSDGATTLFGLDTAAVYLLDGDMLRLSATTPTLPPAFPQGLREARPEDHPHIFGVLETGQHRVLADATTAQLTGAEREVTEIRDLRTVIYFPLLAKQRTVGVLIVGSVGKPRVIGDTELDLCRTLAALSALAVQNARLFRAGRAYAAELEQAIADRDRSQRERLEAERRTQHAQRLESLGLLAGGVAHDFNNLLMAILGNLELALLEIPPASAARTGIRQAADAAGQAAELTRQMLAYAGRGRFEVKAIDVNELVQRSASLLKASVAKSAAVEVLLDRAIPQIEADAGQLQQVVMNLITNASDALGEGPGTITVSTGSQQRDDRDMAQSCLAEQPTSDLFVYLEVADTGCGMGEGTRARIFDPFFSTKADGRGLGLSATLGIVRGHGGAIFVDSEEGRGTAFRVLFPVRPGAEQPRAEVARPPGPRLEGAVLVVDDEPIVRDVCRKMLEGMGLRVITAEDGQRAVEIFRKRAEEIGLVVLDRSMPVMDGPAALEAMLRIDPQAKILMVSGFAEQEIARAGVTGQAGFLQKPFSLRSLREAISKLQGEGSGSMPRSDAVLEASE